MLLTSVLWGKHDCMFFITLYAFIYSISTLLLFLSKRKGEVKRKNNESGYERRTICYLWFKRSQCKVAFQSANGKNDFEKSHEKRNHT